MGTPVLGAMLICGGARERKPANRTEKLGSLLAPFRLVAWGLLWRGSAMGCLGCAWAPPSSFAPLLQGKSADRQPAGLCRGLFEVCLGIVAAKPQLVTSYGHECKFGTP